MSESQQSKPTVDVALSRKPTSKTTPKSKRTLYEITANELNDWLARAGEKPYRSRQFFEHIYAQRQPFETLTTWPEKLRAKFKENFGMALVEEKYQKSRDKTHKWLYKLNDGKFIETVLMIYKDRATVCISSQSGCAMGCTFCETGQAGFDRHFTAVEII